MLTVDEALRLVLEHAGSLPARQQPLGEVLGCILAEDVIADLDLPPFDKALVDGYALRSSDLSGDPPYRVRVGEEITAGRTPSRSIEGGEAAAIMTGAPLPPEADAVVMHEQTRRLDDGAIEIQSEVRAGQNRLTRGREMRTGEVVLRKGDALNAARLGVLASVGREKVTVVSEPLVAIVPTGDELVPVSERPGPGQIRETNSVTIAALVETCGARAVRHDIARDDPAELREALRRAIGVGPAGKPDILLVCGGVSAGKKDLVPSVLESLGIEPVFHKVRVKPGKPLWFGVGPDRSHDPHRGEPQPRLLVFGLPGNPVGAFMSFMLFVRPALDALRGRPDAGHRLDRGPLAAPFVHRGDRPTYYPSRRVVSEAGAVSILPLDWAGSADLRAASQADGFAVFVAGDRNYEPGEVVGFLPLP